MPGLGEIREFAAWLIEAFGAVSSLLIMFVAWLMYQLRCEQRESQEARAASAAILDKLVRIQLEFVSAVTELKNSVEKTVTRDE